MQNLPISTLSNSLMQERIVNLVRDSAYSSGISNDLVPVGTNHESIRSIGITLWLIVRKRNILVWSKRSTPSSMKLTNSFMVSARGISNTRGMSWCANDAEDLMITCDTTDLNSIWLCRCYGNHNVLSIKHFQLYIMLIYLITVALISFYHAILYQCKVYALKLQTTDLTLPAIYHAA